jgi:hypothetical protein
MSEERDFSVYVTEQFSLPEGVIYMHWPDRMSEESFKDVRKWLKLIERKMKRRSLMETFVEKVSHAER